MITVQLSMGDHYQLETDPKSVGWHWETWWDWQLESLDSENKLQATARTATVVRHCWLLVWKYTTYTDIHRPFCFKVSTMRRRL